MKNRSLRIWNAVAGMLLTLAGLGSMAPGIAIAQDGEAPVFIVLDAEGPITPPLRSYILRGLEEADRLNAEAVIMRLDTPGGSVAVMEEIVKDIQSSDVPVIVYVSPPGAQAASAGLFVTLAAHASAMAPGTVIGASSVINADGSDLDTTSRRKAEEVLTAQARSLADRRGAEAVELAEAAVTDARAVNANEALEAGLVDFLAQDTPSLLAQLDGLALTINGQEKRIETRGAVLRPLAVNFVEQFFMLIADPFIVGLLLTMGTLALYVEIRTPGVGVGGVLGVISIALAMYGLGILPFNVLGLAFLAVGIALFIAELFTPTFGALIAGGIVCMAVGIIVLFNVEGIEEFGGLSVPAVIAQSIILGAIFMVFSYFAVKAQRSRVKTGKEGLIGQVGRVLQDLEPNGTVLVAGEHWQAQAEAQQSIPLHSEIEVVAVDGMRLKVKPRQ